MSERKEELKAKAVKPTQDEMQKIMDAKIKRAKDVAGSIKQEMKAKQLSEEELKILDEQEELEQEAGSLKDFIQIQNEYRSNFLNLMGIKKQIEFIEKQLSTKQISMKWKGAIMNEDMLKIDHDLTVHNYKMLLTHMNITRDRLVNFGLTEEEIKDVELQGKLFKELPKKKKDEKEQ